MAPASGPAVVPETIVVDHGKVYVGEDTTSVCARLGISIQPARIREPRDKAPVERFFRTIRESLLQYLDGYKGPDVHSRGLDVEASAFYYIDELEDIIREWVATIYHHRRHRGVLEPELASAPMSPAMMYEHGLNRAGYIEAPSDPQLAYQFLKVVARTIQHYGVELDNRIYSGAVLMKWAGRVSPYTGRFKGKWPIYVDPDDVRNVYFHDHDDHSWHALKWEHAEGLDAPLSDEALKHMRTKAAKKYRFVDDVLALDELLTRWHVDSNSSAVDRRVALNLAREEVPSVRMPSRRMLSRYPKCAPSQNDSRRQPTHSAISNLAKPNPATTTATPNSTPITSRPRTTNTTKTPWRTCDDNITATTSTTSDVCSAGFGPAEAQFDPEGRLGGVCLRHRP